MKSQIATTKEQSDRLLKCGVSAESADMCWMGGSVEAMPYEVMLGQWMIDSAMKGEERTAADFDLSPAFSLGALLGLLPKEIKADGITYKLNIDYPPIGQVAVRYNTEEDDLDSLFGLMGDDLFELIVLMVEKLVANSYKLNDCPCRKKGL